MTKFYVIETVYEGPNVDDHADDHKVIISKKPARTNMSHEVLLNGWCGTTQGYAKYAHGEFDTIEEAREAIEDMFDGVRDIDQEDGDCFEAYGCVEAYKTGQYEQMSGRDSVYYMHVAMTEDITSDTTDEDIEELLDGYDEDAKSEGYALARYPLEQAMIEMRDEKIAQESDAA